MMTATPTMAPPRINGKFTVDSHPPLALCGGFRERSVRGRWVRVGSRTDGVDTRGVGVETGVKGVEAVVEAGLGTAADAEDTTGAAVEEDEEDEDEDDDEELLSKPAACVWKNRS